MKKYFKAMGISLGGGIVLTFLIAQITQMLAAQKINEPAEIVLGACSSGVGLPLVWKTSCPFPPFETFNYGALLGDILIWSVVVFAVVMAYRKLKQ